MVGVSAVRCYRVELQCWIDFIFRPPLFSALVITTHLYYHQKNTSFYNLGVLFYLVNATHRERGILPCQRNRPNGWDLTWFFLVLNKKSALWNLCLELQPLAIYRDFYIFASLCYSYCYVHTWLPTIFAALVIYYTIFPPLYTLILIIRIHFLRGIKKRQRR